MKRARWFALAMPLVNACTTRADLGGGVAADSAELALPIEVLGSGSPDEPVVATVQLPLRAADLSAVQVLHVECHRCGFYGPPEYEALAKPLTKVKASLRINGAATNEPWLDVTDDNVVVDPVAAAHGGINGALVSLGFDVAIDPATRARLLAANQIEFRFNGTDGLSNGFRILDVQFRDGQGKTLSPITKHWADIGLEKIAGQSSTDASARGALLWAARNTLQKSPIVPRTLRAACSDCHAADGRDVQYFNYSNDAIVQRSRFYGLSAEQGQDIAAFLRSSLALRVPHVPAAAPWNPPYQPGPGLDAKPAVEWAAGAGLDAVWSDAASSVKALLGQPIDGTPLVVTPADVYAAFDPTASLNTREMAIGL
ncbi:MAG TPA: hypothetical protein VNW92_30955, partial [Polyangiaceae bacterium]|nr:hypothetical protein [Polyangiaceae bacterium]